MINRRFKRLLYFVLEFVAIGIDMTFSIYYSFFILSTVIGFELLYEDKKLTEIPKVQYLLGVVVIPVLVGWMLHSS